MIMTMDEKIKPWALKRKAALAIEIFQAKTTVAAANRSFDLSFSGVKDTERGSRFR